MKKYLYSIAAAALLLSTTSCGGNKSGNNEAETSEQSEEAETPQTATVKVNDESFAEGDMMQDIRLVPGNYTFNYADGTAVVEIKAKAVGQTDKEVSSDTKFGIYDESGNELGTMIIFSGTGQLSEALKNGNNETECVLTLKYYGFDTPFPEFMAKAKEIKGLEAIEYRKSPDSPTTDGSVNSSDLSTFISNGKSGDIDMMLDALEWENSVEAALKPQVRSLDENAIKTAIEIDKASEEIGAKYDRHNLSGALDAMEDKMTDSQRSRYNTAIANMVHYYTASEDMTEFNNLYRKLRYGI